MEAIPMPGFTVEKIIELRKSGMLMVNPEYQRGEVWSENQKKKLIDSVLRGYPLPLIYLHYKKLEAAGMKRECYEIIDGQQRINALYEFSEGAIKLFDPIKDEKVAKFPNFIRNSECTWAHKRFEDFQGGLDHLSRKFLDTELNIVKIVTDNDDEARDLFIRLQAGLPLNAQEKRDAWPGGYTEFVLKFGGKQKIARYPGHEFFQKLVDKQSTDRGKARQLCAQVGMLFFERAVEGNWMDIGTQHLDVYYYRNIDFDFNSDRVKRFTAVLDKLYELFSDGKRPRLKGHEVIHLILLVDSLMDDYVKRWETKLAEAFDQFREQAAIAKKQKKEGVVTDTEYWNHYGNWTQASSDRGEFIKLRHNFFSRKMFDVINPVLKDPKRTYGQLEREILYYQYKKECQVCESEIRWDNLEIHHVDEHQNGGGTILENGVPVHSDCHPKGAKAIDFARKWKAKQELLKTNGQ